MSGITESNDGMSIVVPDATCTRSTEAAILVSSSHLPAPTWFPVSQVHDDSDVFEEGGEGDLIVSRWIADQKGIL